MHDEGDKLIKTGESRVLIQLSSGEFIDEEEAKRRFSSACIVPSCNNPNEHIGWTNLCGHHHEELVNKIRKLKTKKHPFFYRKRWDKILEKLSPDDILRILNEKI